MDDRLTLPAIRALPPLTASRLPDGRTHFATTATVDGGTATFVSDYPHGFSDLARFLDVGVNVEAHNG